MLVMYVIQSELRPQPKPETKPSQSKSKGICDITRDKFTHKNTTPTQAQPNPYNNQELNCIQRSAPEKLETSLGQLKIGLNLGFD